MILYDQCIIVGLIVRHLFYSSGAIHTHTYLHQHTVHAHPREPIQYSTAKAVLSGFSHTRLLEVIRTKLSRCSRLWDTSSLHPVFLPARRLRSNASDRFGRTPAQPVSAAVGRWMGPGSDSDPRLPSSGLGRTYRTHVSRNRARTPRHAAIHATWLNG